MTISRDRATWPDPRLLDLDGQVLVVDPKGGHSVRFVVTRVSVSPEKPHGIDYSLTLHGSGGESRWSGSTMRIWSPRSWSPASNRLANRRRPKPREPSRRSEATASRSSRRLWCGSSLPRLASGYELLAAAIAATTSGCSRSASRRRTARSASSDRRPISGTRSKPRQERGQPQLRFAVLFRIGVPYGIRTRVTNVKGWCPRPLDERDRRARA